MKKRTTHLEDSLGVRINGGPEFPSLEEAFTDLQSQRGSTVNPDIIARFTQEDVEFLRGIEAEAHREATASVGDDKSRAFILAADKGIAAENLAQRIEAELRGWVLKGIDAESHREAIASASKSLAVRLRGDEVDTTQGGSEVKNPFPAHGLQWCAYEIAAAKWGENIARLAHRLEEGGYGWDGDADEEDLSHVHFTDLCTILAMFSVKDPEESDESLVAPLHVVIKARIEEVRELRSTVTKDSDPATGRGGRKDAVAPE